MLISDYLVTIYEAERPGLSDDYCHLLEATVSELSQYVGKSVRVVEIDRQMLSSWARSLLQRRRPITINKKVGMIRTLLLAAYDDGILDRPPRRLRKLPPNLQPPNAWTVEECRKLLHYLWGLRGFVGQQPAHLWWTSLCLTVYWTACRIGSMLRVTASDYQPGAGLVARQQKNGRSQWYPLPPSCCRAIEAVLPEAGRIWDWPFEPKRIFKHFRKHVEASGIPAPKGHCELFHRLRRTNASYCAAVDPAIAQRQLDHADYATTRQSYVDPSIARQTSAADVLPDLMPNCPQLRVI